MCGKSFITIEVESSAMQAIEARHARSPHPGGNPGANACDPCCVCAQELNGHMKEIKVKADQSEALVVEICRDIKKLDFAKKNLTSTITALRRLGMLGACAG